ncbi:MAG: AMP-binding protein [Candidatus Anaerobiospirillum pullicola]|uniref:AMP-binding protein n=1 Tax=Candidatus Anaerobiospirillum pullicola TaxID=2838451 RepID=A0A948TGG0_9GAMM|nr:AMP-binding protein [Candidatus Anaerobiospirillum pullicola]
MTDLVSLLEASFTQHAARTALRVADVNLTYHELQGRVYHLTAFLVQHQVKTVAVLGYRSAEVEATLLACLYARTTYVPLNPRFPHERCNNMMANAQVDALIVCPECAQYAQDLSIPAHTLVFTDDTSDGLLRTQHSDWTIVSIGSFASTQAQCPPLPAYAEHKSIYIIYTSGTTGEAKGVLISYRAFTLYLLKVLRLYQFTADDVFSQMFEITFDLSLQDLLSAILSGGTLVPIPKKVLFAPISVIKRYGITVFHSVPSVVGYMDKIQVLAPNLLPSVRLSLFVGEPLWYEQVQLWGQTCPHSKIINTYGPTETTVIIATYLAFDPAKQELKELPEHGRVPLGNTLEHAAYSLRDEQQHVVPAGTQGEIYLSGDQMGDGYLGSPQKTAAAFVELEGTIWYRTGDLGLVEQHEGKPLLTFCGRCNDEVKVNGFRVSLLEVDECLQQLAGVRALALPVRDEFSLVHGIIGVLETTDLQLCATVQKQIVSKLPFYMVPQAIRACDNFPLNANGKLDRKALLQLIKDRGELTLG